MSIVTFYFRVKKIKENKNAKSYFTRAEIVNAYVSLLDARKLLDFEANYYINLIYNKFSQDAQKLFLNCEEFTNEIFNIVSHIDLIAPYYKISGNNNLAVASLLEPHKQIYRFEALGLLRKNRIFSSEWMELQKRFVSKFYIVD